MIGTFDYMAPEQMVGGECSAPTDLFTLGVVMYEMITGRLPFGEKPTAAAMLAAQLAPARAPMARYVDVPAALDAIVLQCLVSNPAQRFGSAVELAARLDLVMQGNPDPSQSGLVEPSTTDKMEAVPDTAALPPDPGERTVVQPREKRFFPATTLPGVGPPTKRNGR
jgi:serine/threonine protein kinase